MVLHTILLNQYDFLQLSKFHNVHFIIILLAYKFLVFHSLLFIIHIKWFYQKVYKINIIYTYASLNKYHIFHVIPKLNHIIECKQNNLII